ncbi:MAG: macrocin O-methyltransferase [Candidatus Dadabacteria bacterium]
MGKGIIRRLINLCGYDIVSLYPPDFSTEDIEIVKLVRPYTMTRPEQIVALATSVKYIVENGIRGDLVECGVWRGGSAMAMLYTLLKLGDTERTIYLYDTYNGMTPPGAKDVAHTGESAVDLLNKAKRKTASNIWCWATIEDVTKNVLSTGYPKDKIVLVEGDVRQTIPQTVPTEIALLRLDTDWYESTRHELIHLFPRLTDKGVLIVDDYGHWRGVKDAVDEYFSSHKYKPLLHRIDYSGRYLVKV